ncbi:RbsD/FucU family protein [Ruegeria sp. Ofav3-42]|uniref:RbsD/FucU family protein n=1 Tax=Ruegeria sp. Ofav3-42 TaxID=2917759 RepID=UPI001EF44D43|nr:RbsD/FucU domain-containing protein [Ruegeria sp. Ofav3-42]MCG7519857.1 ribose ABC transporter [Ruegeria sp. Ofav3-42]
MLHNLDPILSPELLYALRAMGHGDEIVIADANFPGSSCGPGCIRADGSTASEILRAILSVMPLDTFVSDPALTMQMVEDPDNIPEAVADFQNIINQVADNPAQIQRAERFGFYERASNAFAIVQTGERRLYGNIILKKGVIG